MSKRYHYVGVADAYGLDSFAKIDTAVRSKMANLFEGIEAQNPGIITMFKFRAQANRHRFAMVYEAYPTEKQAEKIQKLFNNGKYKEALLYIKKENEAGRLPVGVEKSAGKRRWDRIPDEGLAW